MFFYSFNFNDLLEALEEKLLINLNIQDRKIEFLISLEETVAQAIKRITNENQSELFELQAPDGWILDNSRTFRMNALGGDRSFKLIRKS